MNKTIFNQDLTRTLIQKNRLVSNKNLLYWYRELFEEMLKGINEHERSKVLEIGSGASPLKEFYPSVITSDVMPLPGLDLVFDAHEIDKQNVIDDQSLDIILLTNVLHHLERPLEFLLRAQTKLKPGGRIIFAEPYFSMLSTFLYEKIHHEDADLKVDKPLLENISGPLSTANQALPWLIFFRRSHDWASQLKEFYDFDPVRGTTYFTSLAYFITGGISRRFLVPHLCYRFLFHTDRIMARIFYRLSASFFIIRLQKRQL